METGTEWRTEQSRLLVVGTPKVVAADAGLHLNTIYELKNSERPVTALTAFRICKAQHDFRFLQLLAERAGAILQIPCTSLTKRPTILLMADLALSFGAFLSLCEKIQRNEPLSDAEQREIEQTGQDIKSAVDHLIERSRRQRREKHHTGNGHANGNGKGKG